MHNKSIASVALQDNCFLKGSGGTKKLQMSQKHHQLHSRIIIKPMCHLLAKTQHKTYKFNPLGIKPTAITKKSQGCSTVTADS